MPVEQSVVHIVEDDDFVATSIAALVSSVGLSPHVHNSAECFLENYDSGLSGCAVVDVCLPGITGLRLQETIENEGHHLPLIFLTGHADVNMAVVALTHGAFGFLEKPHRNGELLDLVHRAVDYDVQRRNRESEKLRWKERWASLTPRENSVAQLLVQGYTNKEAAEKLKISPRTVELHRARLMEKLSVSSLAEVVQGWLLASDEDQWEMLSGLN